MQITSVSLLTNIYAKQSPPIFEVDMDNWCNKHQEILETKQNCSYKTSGMYLSIDTDLAQKYNLPEVFILISKDQKDYEKVSTVFHEKGHHYCSTTNCYCSDNLVLQEMHADLCAIVSCYRHRQKDALLHCMHGILSRSASCDYPEYGESARKVTRHPYWHDMLSKYRGDLIEWVRISDGNLLANRSVQYLLMD